MFCCCSYSEQLGKWVEVGNSGMFRPEMLRPMGLPEDVSVIAWGLGLERYCACSSASQQRQIALPLVCAALKLATA